MVDVKIMIGRWKIETVITFYLFDQYDIRWSLPRENKRPAEH